MNGSNGRSPCMWVRSWTRSQRMYASRESRGDSRRHAASGGRLRRRISAAREQTRRKRSDSRSQKMPPKRLRRARDALDQLGEAVGVVGGRVDGAVRFLSEAKLGDGVAKLRPSRVAVRRGVGRGVVAGEGGLRAPVHEVEPELAVVEVVDAVVAEEVGVGEGGDAALSGMPDRGERRAG